jgi:hypothetical protein
VRDAFTYLTHGPFRYKIAALWNGVERLPVASGSAGVDHIINYLFDVRLAFFCLFDRVAIFACLFDIDVFASHGSRVLEDSLRYQIVLRIGPCWWIAVPERRS